jgi:hypothetical protein
MSFLTCLVLSCFALSHASSLSILGLCLLVRVNRVRVRRVRRVRVRVRVSVDMTCVSQPSCLCRCVLRCIVVHCVALPRVILSCVLVHEVTRR